MMTLMEDIRLAVRQMLRSAETVATVLPVLVLGIALNVVALKVVNGVRVETHGGGRTPVSKVARTEVRVVRDVIASALKKIGDREQGWCSANRAQEPESQVAGNRAKRVCGCV